MSTASPSGLVSLKVIFVVIPKLPVDELGEAGSILDKVGDHQVLDPLGIMGLASKLDHSGRCPRQ
jgi:hypothetical protein